MVPLVAFIGSSGAGKTRLIISLIQLLSARGYCIGAIKHTHHRHAQIEIDRPGKDSYDLQEAGADPVLLIDADQPESPLEALATRYCLDCDLVLAEGFAESLSPKVVVERSGCAEKPSVRAAWDRGEVIALVNNNVTPQAVANVSLVRCFSANEPRKIAEFLRERILS